MKRKVIFLQDNMFDAEGKEVFQAEIPYTVDTKGKIENEDGLTVRMNDIWVDFYVVHQTTRTEGEK